MQFEFIFLYVNIKNKLEIIMTLNGKINELKENLSESLVLLKELFDKKTDIEMKRQISEVIETHIAYIVFLKELELDLTNKNKNFTKELLIQQFQNIKHSCKLVHELYKEEIDK